MTSGSLNESFNSSTSSLDKGFLKVDSKFGGYATAGKQINSLVKRSWKLTFLNKIIVGKKKSQTAPTKLVDSKRRHINNRQKDVAKIYNYVNNKCTQMNFNSEKFAIAGDILLTYV